MGQVVLLVVAAAWAAVLLPPLLRSRLENRPNSSVLDFRNQLSSLQRAVPTRGVAVRSMGRSLAPSVLSRPAATGRPDTRNGARLSGVVSSRIAPTSPSARPARRDARMQEASLRPRQHGVSDDPRMAAALASSRAAEAKRRRANVLFLLVLTSVCAGFLAATTDSKAMVYLFAVSMVALGGYVYLLVTINQQQYGTRSELAVRAADRRQPVRQRRRPVEVDDDVYDRDDMYWEAAPAPRPAPRQPRAPQYPPQAYDDLPGSGQSGRISYGRGVDVAPQARRDPRDPYGREAYGWETATRETLRRAPVRNGRHATGQVPVQRSRQAEPSPGYYSHTG
jgi:hypothetical protein